MKLNRFANSHTHTHTATHSSTNTQAPTYTLAHLSLDGYLMLQKVQQIETCACRSM